MGGRHRDTHAGINEGTPGVYNIRYNGDGQPNQPPNDGSFDERDKFRDNTRRRRNVIQITFMLILVGLILIGVTVGITLAIVDARDDETETTASPLQGTSGVTDRTTPTSTPSRDETTSSSSSGPGTETTTTTTSTTAATTVTTNLPIETTSQPCNSTGIFYIWIPVNDAGKAEEIFNMIDELMTEQGSVCAVTNFGIIPSTIASRRKRNVQDLYLVIGLDVIIEEFTKADIIESLKNATLNGVDKDGIRIDDVSSSCMLLGVTGSVSETMCRDLGFIYSEYYNYEDKNDSDWLALPEFQQEYNNISCEPASRDIAYCAVHYPDCKNGTQLCTGTCDDLQRNCPSVYHALGFPQDFCDSLPYTDACHGHIKTTTTTTTETTTTTTPAPNSCEDDQFACVSTGGCIPNYWYCDDYQDCADNSDELNCFCPTGTFRCTLSIPTVCIDEDLLCNNAADCPDSSDEADCSSRVVECAEDEFRCIKFPECINASRKCDGTEDCQDRSDEWHQCDTVTTPRPITDFEVRLMQNVTDTTTELVGRVEIRGKGSDGDFGTICGDMWTAEDANVICRMINESFTGEAYAYRHAVFGQGSGNIVMTNVDCHGNESNIGLCKSKRTNIHCSHLQDAAASCGTLIDVPTPKPVMKPMVRLVNGGTCLEGLVQVYMEEEWRYICDDRFDERDATVICRMLGFESGPGRVLDEFGIGDGLFWLDEVKCRGNETDIGQCGANEPGVHDCVYYEAVGIVCGGIPELDCTPEPTCVPNTTCSFDTDDCCMEFPVPAEGDGSTRWIRHRAIMIGHPDHTSGSNEGGVIYYRNNFGSEGDKASVILNSMIQSDPAITMTTNITLTFYYLLQSPGNDALSLKSISSDGIPTVLWSSRYVPSELEGQWLYQCVDIAATATYQELTFESRRGRAQNELVAIDDISLQTGRCENGIAHQPCKFEKITTCDAEIVCNGCDQTDTVFRWRVFQNTAGIPNEVPMSDHIKEHMEGSFLFVDASIGTQKDEAVVKFKVTKEASERAVAFEYILLGDSPSSLQVSTTYEEGRTEYVWRSRSAVIDSGKRVGCIKLPVIEDLIHLNFEAIRGRSPLGDIALDNVKVIDACPGFSNCFKNGSNCNYTIESSYEDTFTWTRDVLEDDRETIDTYRLVDNTSPYGSRSRLVSPEFSLTSVLYQVTYSILKRGTGTLKIYVTDGFERIHIYTEHLYYSDTFEDHCITLALGDLSGAIVVFESIKGSLGLYEEMFNNTEVTFVKDFDLSPGSCDDTLTQRRCSFEDHLCAYTVDNTPSTTPCGPVYEWSRTGGSLNFNLLRSDNDHSLGTKNGHYLAVVNTPRTSHKTTSVNFKHVTIQELNAQRSLLFYVRMLKSQMEKSDLFVNVSGVKYEVLPRLLPLKVWQPVCIDITGLQDNALDVSITAMSVTCDLDDITLITGACPGALTCTFDEDHLCGYTLEAGWTFKGTHIHVSTVESRLISPTFSTTDDSCLALTMRSTTNSTSMVHGKVQFLDNETLRTILYEEKLTLHLASSVEWETIQIQFPPLSNAVFTLSFYDMGSASIIEIADISVSSSMCNNLVCDSTQHVCDNSYCIPSDSVCDGIDDCLDKSDETNCDECQHCYFNVIGDCICTFASLNVQSENGVTSKPRFQFYADLVLSYISTPLLNLTSSSCLTILTRYGAPNVQFRLVRNESGVLSPLANYRSNDTSDVTRDHVNVTLSLYPGHYSLILEVISSESISTPGNDPVLTLENIQISNDLCETETDEYNPNPTTTANPMDTNQTEGESQSVEAYLFSDIKLTCSLNMTSMNEGMVLYWYKEGRQLTYNGEVIPQTLINTPSGIETPKYVVLLGGNITEVIYTLTIQQMSMDDAGRYDCRLDVPVDGVSVITTTKVVVRNETIIPTDDGCFRNTLKECHYQGFEAVIYDSPFYNHLERKLITKILSTINYSLITPNCLSVIESLACGLFSPKCVNGNTLNICREYCMEIVTSCLNEGSDSHQLLHYGCSFLQHSDIPSTCYSESIGCGTTHTSTEGSIWTDNYPDKYPITNCTEYIKANRYHGIVLEVVDFDVGIGNGVDPCYFEIYDEVKAELVATSQCGDVIILGTIFTLDRVTRITFVSDDTSQGRGYKFSYKQVQQYGCKMFTVDDNGLELVSHIENVDNKFCNSSLIYSENERDSLVVEVIALSQGCIIVSTIESDGVIKFGQRICNFDDPVLFEATGQFLLDVEEQTVYTIRVQKNQYVRRVDSITLDDSGRLLMTSEDQYGMACFEIDQPTADIVCQSFNLGWPAEVISGDSNIDFVPSLVSDIRCEGTEQHITDCQFVFEDTAGVCSSESFSAVNCKKNSLKCDFYNGTCGYSLHGEIEYSSTDGLMLKKSNSFTTSPKEGRILSPPFQYSDDSFVSFDYSVDGETEDEIIVELLNVNLNTSVAVVLWERRPYRVAGLLTGCFEMPINDAIDTSYRLVIKLTSHMSSMGYPSSTETAIRRLEISPEACEDLRYPLMCTFENPDSCTEITTIEEIACKSQKQNGLDMGIPSAAYVYRDADWLDNPYNSYNHYLLLDEGHNVTLLKNITSDAFVLRFNYAVYIAPGSESHLTWTLMTEDGVISTIHDQRTNWTSHCIDLQKHISESLILNVGDADDGFSSMAIDNLQLSLLPCPHRYSCGFEDQKCLDHYTSVNGAMTWIQSGTTGYPTQDVTFRTEGRGQFMVPAFDNTAEGSKSVMELHNVGNDVQCLVFYLFIGNSTSSDQVDVFINSKTVTHIKQPLHNKWILHNIQLAGYMDSVQFVATSGPTDEIIAIDEVVLTETPCKDTLDGGNLCTFDNPGLCNMEASNNNGSTFKLRTLNRVSNSEMLSNIMFDADGNSLGSLMYLQSSDANTFNTAELVFKINTTRSAYRFWYYIVDEASTSDEQLEILTTVGATESRVNVDIRNTWVMSPCYTVPAPFDGRIRIKAVLGNGHGRLVAIDHLKLLESENCKDYSPSCDFEQGQACGYISEVQTWTQTGNSWYTTRSGNLTVPVVQNLGIPHCFEFQFNVFDTHTVDGESELTLFIDNHEVWSQFAILKIGNPERHTARINIDTGTIRLMFRSNGLGMYTIWSAKLTEGTCSTILDCDSPSEFRCQDKCINRGFVCNRVVDCDVGEDEAESICGFTMKTNFSNINSKEDAGFVTGSKSSVDWSLDPNASLTVNNKRVRIDEQTLTTQFNTLTITPSILESREYYLSMDISCVYLSFFGNVTWFALDLQYEESENNVVYNVTLKTSTSRRHLAVPVQGGRVSFVLSVYMVTLDPYYRGDLPSNAVFGLYNVEIHEGQRCSELNISCPDDIPNLCRNKMNCYTDDERCNLKSECMDRSDETDNCGYGIPCDFEHPNMCGYRNLTLPKTYWEDRDIYQTPQVLWERIYTSTISRPNTDHTYGQSGLGHFMTSKNYEGLQDEHRYVDTEIMQSPYQTFNTDGCVTFWYYLNSTAHQPKTGTAQLFVYLQHGDGGYKELLWYDHVNRPFTDWVQGGISVQGNRNVSLVIKAVTFIPYDSWTGVVSIDDIDYHSGDCNIQQPECDDTMYSCDDHVCIPHEFVCDGEADCHDGNDEQTCSNRPDGGLQLVGGDGSYGQLGYFYGGQWRPVCFPSDPLEKRIFTLHTANTVCRTLGFSGNYDALPYRFWSKHSDTSIVLSCDSDGECNATPTMEECGFFAYIKCSHEVCFSGETLCPGTISTCKPRHYYCDGETDCPGNTDELDCKCFEGETQCLHIESECKNRTCESCEERGMFECKNHQCIPKSERCDGIHQCNDGTDEYRCVQITEDDVVTVFDRDSLQRKVVCVNNIDVDIAQSLCRLAGQGYVTEILRGNTSITNGVSLSNVEATPSVQEFPGSCFPLKLRCHMSECGTTRFQDSLVQTYVINGRDTTIEEWPWYGTLLGNGFVYCGATLVSPEWAITATHCIFVDIPRDKRHILQTPQADKSLQKLRRLPGVDYSIVVGSDQRDGSGNWSQTRSVSRLYNYGYIDTGKFPFHDITLLKLSESVQISDFTRPICLPQSTTADYIEQMGVKAECYLVGLGATERIFNDPSSFDFSADTLQKKRVRKVPNDVCEREWRKGLPTDDPFPTDVVCFAHDGPSSASCFGDSGGPIMCKNARGRWELVGTISFGFGNCLHDVIPTVATSVLQYGDWIEETTGLS